MRDSIRLGRLAGVPIGLNWTLLAMVALVAGELANNRFAIEAPGHSGLAYGIAGLLTAVGLLLGVLLHELGHAVVAKRFGLEVDGITLSWMGGVTRIKGETVRPGSELLVAGVGPLVSAAVGGLLWLARMGAHGAGAGDLVVAALAWLSVINIVLAVFNLLPASPLDGGRILHASIWAVTRDRWKATRFASTTGVGFGGLIIALAVVVSTRSGDPLNGFFIGIVGWWILISARAEAGMSAVHQALDGMTISQLMRPIGAAPGWITVRAFAEGYSGPRPGCVWLLQGWGGGFEGIVSGDAVGAVPFHQWDLVRPIDVALPISATTGASPQEEALDVLERTSGKEVIIVVDGGHSIGAVLPGDVDALVRLAGRGAVPGRTSPAPTR